MELKATLETRKKKDGSGTYEVIVIKLSEHSEKLVFLNPAELELLKMRMSQMENNNNNFPDLFN